ncbi:MAG: class B sortase [Lachnospiraceae bacterium]|nr:class B sortase [Lachnospiraceae bacterium]
MSKIIQYIKKHRFIQILLFLTALTISYFAGYCTRRVHDFRQQQAIFQQMAQEYRVALPQETTVSQPQVEQTEEQEVESQEAEPQEEIDVIAEFLAIDGHQELYGNCLAEVPDFTALRQINDDIVAYLYLPDSVIDYPVLQHEENGYYLDHNLNGSTGYPGCLYIENMNRSDFEDPATVIYGHHLFTGGMFSDLENFLDPEYLDGHRFYFLYLPDEVRIYEVVLAAKYNNEHLLVSCYTQIEENLYEFHGFEGGEGKLIYDRIQALGLGGNFRLEPGEEEQMIFWSTCLPARNRRIIVGARRITEENVRQLMG